LPRDLFCFFGLSSSASSPSSPRVNCLTSGSSLAAMAASSAWYANESRLRGGPGSLLGSARLRRKLAADDERPGARHVWPTPSARAGWVMAGTLRRSATSAFRCANDSSAPAKNDALWLGSAACVSVSGGIGDSGTSAASCGAATAADAADAVGRGDGGGFVDGAPKKRLVILSPPFTNGFAVRCFAPPSAGDAAGVTGAEERGCRAVRLLSRRAPSLRGGGGWGGCGCRLGWWWWWWCCGGCCCCCCWLVLASAAGRSISRMDWLGRAAGATKVGFEARPPPLETPDAPTPRGGAYISNVRGLSSPRAIRSTCPHDATKQRTAIRSAADWLLSDTQL
jgi:hypothetical protein